MDAFNVFPTRALVSQFCDRKQRSLLLGQRVLYLGVFRYPHQRLFYVDLIFGALRNNCTCGTASRSATLLPKRLTANTLNAAEGFIGPS